LEKARPPVQRNDPVWIPSQRQRSSGSAFVEAAIVLLAASACLIAIVLWLDNAQGGLTGNGVFKAMQLKPWVVAPANAELDPSNYLFFPTYGALCRLLDWLGVWPGDPRKQMTILNAVSGAFSAAIFYLLLRRLTGRRDVALIAAVFHLACAIVLFLAIVNEDIMASYTVLLASMALAAIWFAQPTPMRVVTVAILFTLAWLFEWRLLFPTLPAMLAALWLSERQRGLRAGWIVLFLAVMLATVSAVALAWDGHRGSVGPLGLLYTGKGVDSVWSGFTWAKVWYLWEGIASCLLGTGVTTIPGIPGWDIWRFASSLSVLAIAVISLRTLWRGRNDNQGRALAGVFGGTLLAGQVFNLYSQPNDPQMQLTVMQWLPLGWAFVLIAADRRWARGGLALLATTTLALLVYNVASLAPQRGSDGKWAETVRLLERQADPARTVFLLQGSDWTMIYLSLYWGKTEEGVDALAPAPQVEPRFKWIGLYTSVLVTPRLTPVQHADALRRKIDRALQLGYDVIVSDVWTLPFSELEKTAGTIADRATVGALHRVLHSYVGEPAFTDPSTGAYFRLRTR
jgi:hypothetical protein